MTRTFAPLWLVLALACFAAAGSLSAQRTEDGDASEPAAERDSARYFDANIAPLLARRCLECHDSASREGGLDLSRREAAMAGGASGTAIEPGNAAESLLWEYVELDIMPQDRPPLPDEEKELLRQWIDAGAVWSGDRIDPSAHGRDARATLRWVQRLTVPEYIETVRSAVGVDIEQEARRLLPPDTRADGFRNTAYSLNVDLEHVEAYAELAAIIVRRMDVPAFAARFTDSRELIDADMRTLIGEMGKWLLRGPLEEREIDAFLDVVHAVVEEGGNFDEAAAYVIEAMLQSPRFLYRIERQHGDGSVRPVGDYELASRLSYILWGGPPDEGLMRAADAGELSDRSYLEAQVDRMLEDPRVVDRSRQFVSEWLDLDRLAHLRPDPERFPEWNERLAADMREETLAFFEHVVWQENRPLWELMNAQVTYATPRLAEFYGLEPNDAVVPEYRRPSPPPRVSDGLQALYTFEEGSGAVVHDVSEAGDPIDLAIADPSAVGWSDDGLTVHSSTLIAGEHAADRLIAAARTSNEITLEAWVTPADASQTGPARIVTLSANPSARNFTLGQDGDRFDVRLRTTATSENGVPSLGSEASAVGQTGMSAPPVHVVYTRDASGNAVVYVNGRESGRREVGGNFVNWDSGFRLALANELTGDRPWQGTLHLVAVYNRALLAKEVRRNTAAGARRPAATAAGEQTVGSRPRSGRRGGGALLALYRFDEGGGDVVHDTSGAGEPLDLRIHDTSVVAWAADSGTGVSPVNGLTVNGSTLMASDGPPTRLIDAVRASGEMTLEAWITPADASQSGPARIVTLSADTGRRNFTLGQEGDSYDVRFRTTSRDANGLPSVSSPGGSLATRPTHVVYTRNVAGTGIIYVNGEERAGRDVAGELSNWDDGFRLALANELTGDRPWRGTYHLVAIYSRAFTREEVRSRGQGAARYDLASVPARGGLLTQGSTLTIGGDDASMVARGLFVLEDMLYGAVGNPPPEVDTTPIPPEPGMSRREIAEVRINNPSCAGCHSRFEPFAFGLERFDGIGAYSETDEHGNGQREDGEILFPGSDEPVAYQSVEELMDLLAASPRARMNITRKVTQFALGRPLVESDGPVLEEIHQAAVEGGGTYASLIRAIVLSDLVRMTRTEAER